LTLEPIPTLYIVSVSFNKQPKDILLIGELAQLTGVSADTLRHYERKKVLARPSRSVKGYRLYAEEAVERVNLIRRALAVGFTLDELAQILAERASGSPPCRTVHALATAKLENVKTRLREMELLRDELERLLGDWDKRLMRRRKNTPVNLLQTLNAQPVTTEKKQRKPSAENYLRRKKKRKTIMKIKSLQTYLFLSRILFAVSSSCSSHSGLHNSTTGSHNTLYEGQ
jgi:DNA-binding transcriptional MerR regulator